MATVPSSLRAVRPLVWSAIFWALMALSPTVTLGQSASTIITFDAPGAGTRALQGTFPTSINSKGVIVGNVVDQNYGQSGFLRRVDGTMSTVKVPGAKYTWLDDINDAGTIVGQFSDGIRTLGFLRTNRGQYTYFLPPQTQFLEGSYIDSLGNVAGNILSTYDFNACFLRTSDGVITTFTPPSGFGCFVNGIVNGTVTGSYGGLISSTGFLRYSDGTYSNVLLGDYIGNLQINAAGTLAGTFHQPQGTWYGFIRSTDGVTIYIAVPNALSTEIGSINSSGTVSGSYSSTSDSANHGFQRLTDGTIQPFDAPGAGTGSSQGTFPLKINDAGSIAGRVIDSNSVCHGFLLTP